MKIKNTEKKIHDIINKEKPQEGVLNSAKEYMCMQSGNKKINYARLAVRLAVILPCLVFIVYLGGIFTSLKISGAGVSDEGFNVVTPPSSQKQDSLTAVLPNVLQFDELIGNVIIYYDNQNQIIYGKQILTYDNFTITLNAVTSEYANRLICGLDEYNYLQDSYILNGIVINFSQMNDANYFLFTQGDYEYNISISNQNLQESKNLINNLINN